MFVGYVLGAVHSGDPRDHPTYFMLIVFASSFRILVTFAIVLDVRGIPFFQIL